MFRRENGDKFIPFCIPKLIPDLYHTCSDELTSFSSLYTYVEYPLCVRNKTFDLGPLSHCLIYTPDVQDLIYLWTCRWEKRLCPVSGQCGDVVYFQFLVLLYFLLSCGSAIYSWGLVASCPGVLHFWSQEAGKYTFYASVYNLLGWKSLSQPAVDNRTPSLHKV